MKAKKEQVTIYPLSEDDVDVLFESMQATTPAEMYDEIEGIVLDHDLSKEDKWKLISGAVIRVKLFTKIRRMKNDLEEEERKQTK